MNSFVGDLWKKVGEIKFNSNPLSSTTSTSSFPYIYDRTSDKTYTIGPFTVYTGQDRSDPAHREDSVFRRVSVFVCKNKSLISSAKQMIKSLKIMKHPRILKYLASQEASEEEVVLVTEWAEPMGKTEPVLRENQQWRGWATWSATEVVQFLHKAGRSHGSIDNVNESLWVSAGGELKIAFFSDYSNPDVSLEGELELIRRTFNISSTGASEKGNVLINLSHFVDFMATYSSGERVYFIKKLLVAGEWEKYPERVRMFMILLEVVRGRKVLMISTTASSKNPTTNAADVSISIEEVELIFKKGSQLIKSQDDFMFLLSDLFVELLSKASASNNPPLILCLLEQLAAGLSDLFSEKYAQDSVLPQISNLLQCPLPIVREGALKALNSLIQRLNGKVVENDVLRMLARMQGDVEGPLRLQTISILCKVMGKIPEKLKAKICGPALIRSLTDPFLPCKRAGLKMMRLVGIDSIEIGEIVGKIVPAVVVLTVEKDTTVREEAFGCLEGLLIPILKNNHQNMMAASKNTGSSSSSHVTANKPVSVSEKKTTNTVTVNTNTSNMIPEPHIPIPSTSSSISGSSSSATTMVGSISRSNNNINIDTLSGNTDALPIEAVKSGGNKMRLGSIKKIS